MPAGMPRNGAKMYSGIAFRNEELGDALVCRKVQGQHEALEKEDKQCNKNRAPQQYGAACGRRVARHRLEQREIE